jgi:hypothetical protein
VALAGAALGRERKNATRASVAHMIVAPIAVVGALIAEWRACCSRDAS